MITKSIKKYIISFVFFFHLLFNVLCSHWFQEAFPLPLSILRIITILIYFPYLSVIVLKLVMDIKERSLFKGINIIYYSFCAYYVLVSIWRLLKHNEVKESFYYFVVIVGALAFFIQVFNRKLLSKECIIINATICTAILCIYRTVLLFMVNRTFSYLPINAIVFACVFLISIPFLVNNIDKDSRTQKIVFSILLGLSIVFVLLSGSRASFYLLLLTLFAVAVFMIIKNRKALLRFFAVIFGSLIVVALLFAVNFSDVRKNIVREVWFLNTVVKVDEPVSGENENDNDNENDIEELIEQQNQQIDRSDTGRKELMIYGINEIKKNPVFGTGDVLYLQQMTDTYIANQSSHNFIIESLVSYGIIGTVLLMAVFGVLFVKALKEIDIKHKFYLILTAGVLLAFSCIQPLFFNAIVVFPLFIIYSALSISSDN